MAQVDENHPLCKTKTCLSCIVNTMAADVLATYGAKASAAIA